MTNKIATIMIHCSEGKYAAVVDLPNDEIRSCTGDSLAGVTAGAAFEIARWEMTPHEGNSSHRIVRGFWGHVLARTAATLGVRGLPEVLAEHAVLADLVTGLLGQQDLPKRTVDQLKVAMGRLEEIRARKR